MPPSSPGGKQEQYDPTPSTSICDSAAWQAATLLTMIFALYLVLGETTRPAIHGAVFDDDGSYPAPFGVFRGAVLDGGSGKIAVSAYSCDLGPDGCQHGSVRETGSSRFKLDLISAVNDATPDALLDAVDEAAGADATLSIGLTGGVRAALARADLTTRKIDAFFDAVKKRRPTGRLAVLSGADEAAFELRAGSYVGVALGAGTVATISAGGASSQLAAGGRVASLATDLLGVEGRAAVIGDAEGLKQWREALDAELRDKATPELLSAIGAADVVLGLAMHASAAQLAGVGGRRVGKQEALAALDSLVDAAAADGAAWRAVDAPNPYGLDAALLRRATLFSAARTSRIVGALPEASNFHFARAYDGLTCDWSLGLFLDEARRAAASGGS